MVRYAVMMKVETVGLSRGEARLALDNIRVAKEELLSMGELESVHGVDVAKVRGFVEGFLGTDVSGVEVIFIGNDRKPALFKSLRRAYIKEARERTWFMQSQTLGLFIYGLNLATVTYEQNQFLVERESALVHELAHASVKITKPMIEKNKDGEIVFKSNPNGAFMTRPRRDGIKGDFWEEAFAFWVSNFYFENNFRNDANYCERWRLLQYSDNGNSSVRDWFDYQFADGDSITVPARFLRIQNGESDEVIDPTVLLTVIFDLVKHFLPELVDGAVRRRKEGDPKAGEFLEGGIENVIGRGIATYINSEKDLWNVYRAISLGLFRNFGRDRYLEWLMA